MCSWQRKNTRVFSCSQLSQHLFSHIISLNNLVTIFKLENYLSNHNAIHVSYLTAPSAHLDFKSKMYITAYKLVKTVDINISNLISCFDILYPYLPFAARACDWNIFIRNITILQYKNENILGWYIYHLQSCQGRIEGGRGDLHLPGTNNLEIFPVLRTFNRNK